MSGVTALARQGHHATRFELVPKIVFSSNRAHPACAGLTSLELLLMDPDGTNVERRTDNEGCTHGDLNAVLSPDGKKIAFDRFQPPPPNALQPSRLFVMSSDGTGITFVTAGTSTTWSADSKYLAFAASASYYTSNGVTILPPIRNQPGAPAIDNDIFVANVDDVVGGTAVPKNMTNSPDMIDEDADWSPDGTRIAFTSDPVSDAGGVPQPPFNPFN